MTAYEELIKEADQKGCIVVERDLTANDGLIVGKRIGIRKSIRTEAQKADVLAEEIAHYESSCGNILNQSISLNRQQELRARLIAYDKRIGLSGLIRAYEHGCQTFFDVSEYLGVQESFLREAIDCYKRKYGTATKYEDYIVCFEPRMAIIRTLTKGELK